MSNNNQNQAMQRFFEFIFNVPGDCFCCTWSISCFLETVEHMEGDKRWRSICTIGMSLLSLLIVFLLTLALCPRFYWSEINQIVMTNTTTITPHIDYSSSTYVPTMYLNSTALNKSFVEATNSLLQSPINDIVSDDDQDDVSKLNDDKPYNLTIHSVIYQHLGLHLNLWHINYCTQNYSNDTYYKTYLNSSDVSKTGTRNLKKRIFINNTATVTNQTCSFITYRQSGTTSSTQDLSLWFIIFVIILLLLGCGCVLGTHPIFDKCHRKNTTLRSSIQKILAIAITILCACILNWSSFVFAAVFENQVEKYQEWQERVPIAQSNLGTGMLAVNGAMLLGIILSVIHCGAPIRTDLNANNENNGNGNNDNDNVQNDNSAGNSNGANNDNINDNDDEKQNEAGIRLTSQQRMLLRHIPGGNSSMPNMAILANPESWFKNNTNHSIQNNTNIVDNGNNNDDVMDIPLVNDEDEEFKEFEYQNMNLNDDKEEEDDAMYANLSMKRILKKDKKRTSHKDDNDDKTLSLLEDIDDDKQSKETVIDLNSDNNDID